MGQNMTNTAKIGRPAGAGKLTKSERDVIRLGVRGGLSVATLAEIMGRGESTIYNALKRMEKTGEDRQAVMDLGQIGRASK